MRYLLIVCCIFIYACSTPTYNKNNYGVENVPSVYEVQKGDSLFAIAWRYGLDMNRIQQVNKIVDPNRIFVGQKLKLKAADSRSRSTTTVASRGKSKTSGSTSSRPSSTAEPASHVPQKGNWVWPMRGAVVRKYNPNQIGSNGIRIAGKPNQTINAAEGGLVVYQGSGLNGYGNVVIIKHNNGLLSAYGFLSKAVVKEGQQVKKRQKIGTVGYGNNKELMLHFEVRRGGKPVNPLGYIGSVYHF